MDVSDAAALIAPAVRVGEVWADLGAGGGTFSRALASLVGPAGRIYAVDRDPAVRRLAGQAGIIPRQADFTTELDLPTLNGALLANALHFVAATEQAGVLRHIARHMRSEGRIVVVEYEGRAPSRWVPFPISFERFVRLVEDAGLAAPVRIGTRRSAFGGTMFAASAEVPAGPG
jgi:ubiquinone/menaquinone biosynthesis C-methylase UbiE